MFAQTAREESDEFDRLMHIARFREMPYLARKHAGLFQARFDKHPNLEKCLIACFAVSPIRPFRFSFFLLFVSFHASSSSSPIRPFAGDYCLGALSSASFSSALLT